MNEKDSLEKRAQMKPELTTREDDPYNAEPHPFHLGSSFLTPVEQFYVRNHGDMPVVKEENFRLEIGGLAGPDVRLTLEDLRREYPQVTTVATLQCAGNRRTEFDTFQGTPWQSCALGTASWHGVLLKSVLGHRTIEAQNPHLIMTGGDTTEMNSKSIPYECSVPLELAFRHGALLAWEMNGEPLTTEHGHPLRMIIPGLIAARSVKWLTSIRLSEQATTNPHFTEAYKIAPLETESADWHELPPISVFQLSSVICTPTNRDNLKPGDQILRGYAVPRGDTDVVIARVEVRVDDQPWRPAEIVSEPKPFCWCLWESTVSMEEGRHRIAVRAWDTTGRLQEENPNPNTKGYRYSGWHTVQVEVSS